MREEGEGVGRGGREGNQPESPSPPSKQTVATPPGRPQTGCQLAAHPADSARLAVGSIPSPHSGIRGTSAARRNICILRARDSRWEGCCPGGGGRGEWPAKGPAGPRRPRPPRRAAPRAPPATARRPASGRRGAGSGPRTAPAAGAPGAAGRPMRSGRPASLRDRCALCGWWGLRERRRVRTRLPQCSLVSWRCRCRSRPAPRRGAAD